mmetsp:Transcript_38626/g.90756  ORF Transcript_38626/g.90756 Transcript_38626/m.90756 type:complete len:164 (-) Transcript_38626:138-629(-)
MPSERETGIVTAWNMARPGKRNAEGYGFVAIDGKEDSKATNVFLYADNIKDSKLRSQAKIFGLKQGQRISFTVKEARSSRQSSLAVDVLPLEGDNSSSGQARNSRSHRSSSRRRSPPRRSPPRRSLSARRSRRSPSVRRPAGRSRSRRRGSQSEPRRRRSSSR